MFEGKKVRLRAYRKEDITQALEYINDPEVKRNLVIGVPFPLRLEDEEKFFENISAAKDTYSFAIETLDGSNYIGGCGMNQVDWKNRYAVVGIFIGDEQYRGKGYGSDAMRVLLRFIFDEMNMNRVKLFVFSFNQRAIKSYLKCGFKQEGTQRQEMFRDGQYHDTIVMGILRSEWEKLNN
jgi:RimJ/RimL family protein N-acetyltransferase